MTTVDAQHVVCLAPHALDDSVRCVLDKGHADDIDHEFGDEPGMAVWKDGERAWRYRPYESVEQARQLHGIADWAAVPGEADLFGTSRAGAGAAFSRPTNNDGPLLRLFDEASWRIKAAYRALINGWETQR